MIPPAAESGTIRPDYLRLVGDLKRQFDAIPGGAPIRLAKPTSNLFRTRSVSGTPGLDVSGFDGVLSIDRERRTADVLGMTTYEHLVDATLPAGLIPMVVPQLKTITLGGAVTGLGIESSSFKYGLAHESVLEMDVLTGTGEIITVTNRLDDPNRDLYLAFPNSYGTLGYALRLRIELVEAARFVALRHLRFGNAERLSGAIDRICRQRSFDGEEVDFIDGTVFAPGEHYLTLGRFTDELPADVHRPSDYTGMEIYYQSIRRRHTDVLTTRDYLWRWDTDWFWCSRALGVQRPLVRRLWPKAKLRSDVYWKVVAADRRHRFTARWDRLRGRPPREEVVQDIEVPVERLAEFLRFFHRDVGIRPVWLCPLRSRDGVTRWPLYELDPDVTYVNVGFWSTVELPPGADPADGTVNRRIEYEVSRLGGHKSLYSTAYYPRDQFDALYGGPRYSRIKQRYDPDRRLLDLYDKVVGRK